MLRCAELGLPDSAIENMSCGMVYDMLIEQGNDNEKYPIRGKTGGMRAFFTGGGN